MMLPIAKGYIVILDYFLTVSSAYMFELAAK